jgi:hypothetical protein
MVFRVFRLKPHTNTVTSGDLSLESPCTKAVDDEIGAEMEQGAKPVLTKPLKRLERETGIEPATFSLGS